MRSEPRTGVAFLPKHCRFLDQEVWGILTEQPDHTWQITNCLDKHEACFKHHCAFSACCGEWPFSGDKTVSIVKEADDQSH